ncbi:hypothetical protein RHGRI_036002 [Rhododendron griersonianum]|uniref:Uncharacterized protein n=1 Tax=Rhododendron griersonianum TaxID=479676 RepID=A0AAV6HQI1_9ERIC|nr:hypothetical protein RHGRI_036002 [Rhododendron griersonianum]
MLKQSLSLDQRIDAVKECRISLNMLPPSTEFRGWFFLIFGCASFSGFFYAAIISNFLPPSDNALISAVQNDRSAISRRPVVSGTHTKVGEKMGIFLFEVLITPGDA